MNDSVFAKMVAALNNAAREQRDVRLSVGGDTASGKITEIADGVVVLANPPVGMIGPRSVVKTFVVIADISSVGYIMNEDERKEARRQRKEQRKREQEERARKREESRQRRAAGKPIEDDFDDEDDEDEDDDF